MATIVDGERAGDFYRLDGPLTVNHLWYRTLPLPRVRPGWTLLTW